MLLSCGDRALNGPALRSLGSRCYIDTNADTRTAPEANMGSVLSCRWKISRVQSGAEEIEEVSVHRPTSARGIFAPRRDKRPFSMPIQAGLIHNAAACMGLLPT